MRVFIILILAVMGCTGGHTNETTSSQNFSLRINEASNLNSGSTCVMVKQIVF